MISCCLRQCEASEQPQSRGLEGAENMCKILGHRKQLKYSVECEILERKLKLTFQAMFM
jgi:hypothetical protein